MENNIFENGDAAVKSLFENAEQFGSIKEYEDYLSNKKSVEQLNDLNNEIDELNRKKTEELERVMDYATKKLAEDKEAELKAEIERAKEEAEARVRANFRKDNGYKDYNKESLDDAWRELTKSMNKN